MNALASLEKYIARIPHAAALAYVAVLLALGVVTWGAIDDVRATPGCRHFGNDRPAFSSISFFSSEMSCGGTIVLTLSRLEPIKLWLMLAGGVVGVVLTLAPALLPKYQDYLPSASAFGLAWVFNWYYGLLFFLGALVALLVERRNPKLAEELTLPVASGVVAGGSLMGVALVFWANGGSILSKLFGR